MSDIDAISQLVLRERQGRDRGWWDQMRSCFAADSMVTVSWYRGNGDGFTDGSKKMFDSGFRPVHRTSPPVVHQHGDRAVLELPLAIEARVPFDGVETDLTSYSRMLYQVERIGGEWKVKVMTPIYERDTVYPTVPGTSLKLDLEKLKTFRSSYRFIAYHIWLGGRTMVDNLLGDDEPAAVEELYSQAFAWMRG